MGYKLLRAPLLTSDLPPESGPVRALGPYLARSCFNPGLRVGECIFQMHCS